MTRPRHRPRRLAVLGIAILSAGCATPGAFSSPAASNAVSSASAGPRSAPPSRSPDATDTGRGTWLAYQSTDSGNHIRIAHPDGSGDHWLVDGSHPDWSPDGEWVAYQVDDRDIWIVRVDGTDPRRVFDCEDPCVIGDSAAWSPDGREIAFTTANAVGEVAPHATITAVDVETGTLRALLQTDGPDYPFYPRWSPDGRAIVVAIQRFATTKVSDCSPIGSAIGIVDLATRTPTPRMLTEFSAFADYPDWSPDGTIVFTTHDLGTRDYGCAIDPAAPSDLYTIHPDGSGQTQLTHNPTGTSLVRALSPVNEPGSSPRGTASGPLSGQPTWTPDGRAIIFTYVDGPTWPGYQVWVMAADGTSARALGTSPIVGSHARLRAVGYTPPD